MKKKIHCYLDVISTILLELSKWKGIVLDNMLICFLGESDEMINTSLMYTAYVCVCVCVLHVELQLKDN